MIDRTDPNRTIFLIPEAHMPRLEREIAKLSAKAEKWHGWTFDCLIFGFQFRDERDGTKSKLIEVCLDVETIKIDGWEFIARLDHSPDTGNIVRSVPNAPVEVAERFRHAAPDCEHCNHRRLRRDTFVLYHADSGEYRQVGSTCLADFLGHEAAKLGRIAEWAGYATELARALEKEPVSNDPRVLQDHRYIDLPQYLLHCAAMVRTRGWVSAKTAYENEALQATRWAALDNMLCAARHPVEIEEGDRELADKALQWAQGFRDKASLSEYEHNVLTVAESLVIDSRSCGLAASIVGVFHTRHTPKRGAVQLGDLKPMLAMFRNAGSRLRHPKINLSIPGAGTIVLTVAGERANKPGTINVKSPGSYENSSWYGRVELDGTYKPSQQAPKGIEAHLLAFAADPAKVAAEHGHRTGQCCFCSRPLTDERSTEVGYGPICAKNYQLRW